MQRKNIFIYCERERERERSSNKNNDDEFISHDLTRKITESGWREGKRRRRGK
jgi:hypothetical protein